MITDIGRKKTGQYLEDCKQTNGRLLIKQSQPSLSGFYAKLYYESLIFHQNIVGGIIWLI